MAKSIIITGKIQRGRGLGKQMSFPTINIPYSGKIFGIYAGEVLIDGKKYVAAIHLGPRPTVGDENPICEAFLLNFDEELSEGIEVVVRPMQKIRDVLNFKTLDELKAQIARDVEFVKSCYNI